VELFEGTPGNKVNIADAVKGKKGDHLWSPRKLYARMFQDPSSRICGSS